MVPKFQLVFGKPSYSLRILKKGSDDQEALIEAQESAMEERNKHCIQTVADADPTRDDDAGRCSHALRRPWERLVSARHVTSENANHLSEHAHWIITRGRNYPSQCF
uniref:Uncharacterized protein n=1 Tax=Strigamia maritima TaxID=126957 RepID=T1IVZ8_STRMM